MDKQGFKGSSTYVLDEELAKIVNISMRLEMPLLLKGDKGYKIYRSQQSKSRRTDPNVRSQIGRQYGIDHPEQVAQKITGSKGQKNPQ